MNISGIRPVDTALRADVIRSKRIEEAPKAPGRPKDVYLRGAAHASDGAAANAIAKAQPDIRADLIEKVKERIKAGFYDSDEVMDSLAEKLIANL